MRKGEFKDGEHVLRAKIDMADANMKMRDPMLYRIRHSLDVVAVSQAPSPESNPDSPSPVVTMVGTATTLPI